MYRIKVREKSTGKVLNAWEYYKPDDIRECTPCYSFDLWHLNNVDMDKYEVVDKEASEGAENAPKEPFELFGIECGSGWYGILEPIIRYIDDYNERLQEGEHPIEILQIKEKFGGLRFYVSSATEELDKMIDKAEDESYMTCETCGGRKDVGQTLGWIETVCKNCLTKRTEANPKLNYLWRLNDVIYNVKGGIFTEKTAKDESLL